MALPHSRIRFIELMTELFQLDEAESLDFGLYRIIRRHNREVRDFLGEIRTVDGEQRLHGGRLDRLLDEAFARTDDEAEAELRERLADLESQLGLSPRMTANEREAELAVMENKPLTRQAVKDYRALVEQRRSSRTVDLDRDEVLNRLYQFFARHYQDGDFIVERRYGRDGSRYIRSTGEDTEFHWATEDMYYIKSGDIFTDYPVRLSSGQRLVFSVASDTLQETRASLKPSDKAHYTLSEVVTAEDGSLKVILDYLKGGQTETKKKDIVAAIQGRLGGDEAEIKRWLNRFIARNQSDFFIHKRLKEALTDDLDIFIKTEVLDADQLLAGGDLPRRMTKVARIVRQVGRQIIAFLATLEDFQKQLWEKKKLVFTTRYVITLDRIARLAGEDWLNRWIDAIVKAQKVEWQQLGLGTIRHADDCVEDIPGDLATPGRRRWLPLPVDTGNLDDEFKWALLAAVTAETGLDDALDGVAIHSENWQAMNTLIEKYRGRIKAVYADPPYNTDAGPIHYKNGYRSSSWLQLIENRLGQAKNFLSDDGVICITIDDYQVHELGILMDSIFGAANHLGTALIRNNPSGRSTIRGFSICHEYAFYFGNSEAAKLARLPRSEKQLDRFKIENGIHVDWRNFRKDGGAVTHRIERPKQFYPIYVDVEKKSLRVPELSWNNPKREWDILEEPTDSETVVWPIDEKGKERVWSLNHISAIDNLENLDIRIDKEDKVQIFRKHIPSEGVVPRSWWDKNTYAAREYGSATLASLFGESSAFSFAKSPFAVQDCIWVSGLDSDSDEFVLDFFAGSGTTGHAVLNLNSEDNGSRKFILVELDQYIEKVTVPRLKKIAASRQWKQGRAIQNDGPGLFMRVQALEQYEDTLENLDQSDTLQTGLSFDDPAFSLRYRLDRDSHAVYCAIDHFRSPRGYRLRRAEGAGDAPQRAVDLVESLIYLLGLRVDRLYREPEGVVITGQDQRQRSVTVLFRDCDHDNSASWCERKLSEHDADRVFTNHAATLSFKDCDRFEAIEAVFARQFER